MFDAVLKFAVTISGHGEWEDPEIRTRCRILWRRPEQLASDIYEWLGHTKTSTHHPCMFY
jgi:hypothetical protein